MTSTERGIEAGVEHAEAEFDIGDPYWPAQAAVLAALGT